MRCFGVLAMLFSAYAGAGELAWQGVTEIAAGRGERGQWRQNESRYDYVDDPTVAIDERGEMLVAWVDQVRKDVFFQRLRSASAPVNVSRSPATFSWLPRIAVDSQKVYVLWQEIIFSGGSHGGEILFARSEDGGATFSPPLNLSNSVAGDGKGRINRDVWHNGSLDLAAGRGDEVYAAWTEYEGALWFARSSNGGKSFLPLVRIHDNRPARAPSIAVGSDGTIYLAWTVGDDPAADIRVARSSDGGVRFAPPRIVERTKAYSDAPKLALDPSGRLHLVFADDDRIRYSYSTDGAQSFAPPRHIEDARSGFPQLALDAKGGVYVTWELFRDHRHRPRGLGYTISRDSGRSFSAPAVIPESADRAGGWNGSQQGLLMRKLAVNRDGALAIVNSSLQDNERSRIWLMRAAP
jgi:hypothetical protein